MICKCGHELSEFLAATHNPHWKQICYLHKDSPLIISNYGTSNPCKSKNCQCKTPEPKEAEG